MAALILMIVVVVFWDFDWFVWIRTAGLVLVCLCLSQVESFSSCSFFLDDVGGCLATSEWAGRLSLHMITVFRGGMIGPLFLFRVLSCFFGLCAVANCLEWR